MAQHLLDVRDLCISFVGRDGRALEAVNKLNLHIDAGEIVGVVGESGCGKSLFAQSVMRLLEHEQKMAYEGQILFDGEDLLVRPLKTMREVRGCDIAMIFQDPLSSLNPVMTVGAQVVEAVRDADERHERALSALASVGLLPEHYDRYPHDLSGGQRQRLNLARALICEPRLVVCDEPVSALDVSVQAQVLNLLRELKRTTGVALLFITHDMRVVRHMSDRIGVLYHGCLVEEGAAEDVIAHPSDPYTQALIDAIP